MKRDTIDTPVGAGNSIDLAVPPLLRQESQSTGLSVEVRDVDFSYSSHRNRNEPMLVLNHVSLKASSGEIVAIVGRSGCGKSTLLRLVADLLTPTSGAILVGGHPSSRSRLAGEFGFVFQDPVLLPWRTALQNICLPLEISGARDGMSRVAELLRLVGLAGFEHYYPAGLSGGMRSRVAIARALVTEPRLIFMDESFADLDVLTREQITMEFLRIVNVRRATVLFVTHNITEAVFVADRVYVMAGAPATVAAELEISLPRPRITPQKEQPQFFDYIHKIRALLGANAAV